MELSGVYLAASASRPNPHPAARRTDCTAADPGSAGSTAWKDTCTPCCRDERKRGSPSAKSCVRCPLLFSRTTPEAYKDSIVMLGGDILSTRHLTEGTLFEVLQKPLETTDRPLDTDRT